MRCGRTTRAPGSTTSTRRRSGARSAARPSTTWRRCARSSGSWSVRGTCSGPTASLSSPRRPCAGLVTPRCAGCSPSCPRAAPETTTSTTPGRPVSTPAAPGRGASATSKRSTPRRPSATRCCGPGCPPRVRLSVSDFEVGETERRTTAAVCLLVDLSYSMALRGTWGVAKQTALALHALVRSKYPQDSIQVIGFSNYARELRETDLAGLGWDMVQGTNLHHALILAGRFLDRRPEQNPVVLVVTDGEPTAHLRRDGQSWFDWPPSPETLELTLAEVDKMTRRRATLNVFMLADDARLSAFVDNVARRNGGRVLQAAPERLGEYVIRDFLRTRGASRR